MGRRKTPQEKKQNAYKKDVISVEEYPKSKATGRARAKAGANRAYRSKVRSLLSDPSDPDSLEAKGVSKIRRKQVWKTQVVALGEAVRSKLQKRRDRLGWNYFKDVYSSGLHRERFISILEPIVAGRTEESHEISLVFQEILEGEELASRKQVNYGHTLTQRNAWLRAFFKDAPEWEPKLRKWISKMSALHGEKG